VLLSKYNLNDHVKGRLIACMEDERNAFRVSVGKAGRKRPLTRDRCRWEGNIKMDLREVGFGGYGLE
jgi:hypothetical protein